MVDASVTPELREAVRAEVAADRAVAEATTDEQPAAIGARKAAQQTRDEVDSMPPHR